MEQKQVYSTEEQYNSILTALAKKDIPVELMNGGKIFIKEEDVPEVTINNVYHLGEFLDDLQKLEYVKFHGESYSAKRTFSITGKGMVFIKSGGFKKENMYWSWIKNPDNLWKVITVIFSALAAIITASIKATH
jgi:hypothetical protein